MGMESIADGNIGITGPVGAPSGDPNIGRADGPAVAIIDPLAIALAAEPPAAGAPDEAGGMPALTGTISGPDETGIGAETGGGGAFGISGPDEMG